MKPAMEPEQPKKKGETKLICEQEKQNMGQDEKGKTLMEFTKRIDGPQHGDRMMSQDRRMVIRKANEHCLSETENPMFEVLTEEEEERERERREREKE